MRHRGDEVGGGVIRGILSRSVPSRPSVGLARLFQSDGFASIAEAVGTAQGRAPERRPNSLMVP
jgi:hypothetical protein